MSDSGLRKEPFDFDVSRWGQLPQLRGLFVTGTDTEVGKTLIAGASLFATLQPLHQT